MRDRDEGGRFLSGLKATSVLRIYLTIKGSQESHFDRSFGLQEQPIHFASRLSLYVTSKTAPAVNRYWDVRKANFDAIVATRAGTTTRCGSIACGLSSPRPLADA